MLAGCSGEGVGERESYYRKGESHGEGERGQEERGEKDFKSLGFFSPLLSLILCIFFMCY